MNFKLTKTNKKALMYYVYIVLTGLLAFIAAYFQSPVFGFFATIPLMPLFALACGFIPSKWWMSTVFFGVFAYALRLPLVTEGIAPHYFALICAVIAASGKVAAYLMKNKKLLTVFGGFVLIAGSVAVHTLFFGNPVTAFKAKNISDEYFQNNYDTDKYVLTPLYYDYEKNIFRAEIYEKEIPMIKKNFTVMGGVIFDEFMDFYKSQLMNATRLEIVNLLQSAFPGDKIKVEPEIINGIVKVAGMNVHTPVDKMSFNIILTADLNPSQYETKISDYRRTIYYKGPNIKNISFIYIRMDIPTHKLVFVNNMLPQAFNYSYINGDFFTKLLKA